MKKISLFLFVLLLLGSLKIYAYDNNPTDVAMTRSGSTATITWTSVGADYYYYSLSTASTFVPAGTGFPDASAIGISVIFDASSNPTGVQVSVDYAIPAAYEAVTLYAFVIGVESAGWTWTAPPDGSAGAPAPPMLQ